MSWEADYRKEHDAERKKYEEDLYADYRAQFCTPEMKGFDNTEYTYLWYLTTRMYWEGLPAKEPRV